jgi:hypothetical protein
MARAANLGMGALPARTFHAFLNRRNVFDEWGLEVRGGWATGDSFIGDSYLPYAYCNTVSAEVSRVKPGSAAAVAGLAVGDRLITVNEVFVVFLPVRDVMIAFDICDTTAQVEFERWVLELIQLWEIQIYHRVNQLL